MKRMLATGLVTFAALTGWMMASAALAEDVKVHVVGEGEPNPAPVTDSPKPTVAQPAPAAADKLAHSGDYMVDHILGQLKLSPEQIAAVNAVIKDHKSKTDAELADLRKQLEEVGAETRKAWMANKDNPEASARQREELQDRYQALMAQLQKKMSSSRDDLSARLQAALDADTAARFKTMLEEFTTPEGRARKQARNMVPYYTGGVELTEEQKQRIQTVLADKLAENYRKSAEVVEACKPLYEQQREAYRQNDTAKIEELRKQIAAAYAPLRENWTEVQKAVEAQLTPQQQEQLTEQRRQRQATANEGWIRSATWRFKSVKLTDQQQTQVKALSEAARKALDDIPPDNRDYTQRTSLVQQLGKDIEALLTDEQKKELSNTSRRYYYRRGGYRPGDNSGGESRE